MCTLPVQGNCHILGTFLRSLLGSGHYMAILAFVQRRELTFAAAVVEEQSLHVQMLRSSKTRMETKRSQVYYSSLNSSRLCSSWTWPSCFYFLWVCWHFGHSWTMFVSFSLFLSLGKWVVNLFSCCLIKVSTTHQYHLHVHIMLISVSVGAYINLLHFHFHFLGKVKMQKHKCSSSV